MPYHRQGGKDCKVYPDNRKAIPHIVQTNDDLIYQITLFCHKTVFCREFNHFLGQNALAFIKRTDLRCCHHQCISAVAFNLYSHRVRKDIKLHIWETPLKPLRGTLKKGRTYFSMCQRIFLSSSSSDLASSGQGKTTCKTIQCPQDTHTLGKTSPVCLNTQSSL